VLESFDQGITKVDRNVSGVLIMGRHAKTSPPEGVIQMTLPPPLGIIFQAETVVATSFTAAAHRPNVFSQERDDDNCCPNPNCVSCGNEEHYRCSRCKRNR